MIATATSNAASPVRPTERLLLFYLAITSVVALLRFTAHPDTVWVLAANGLAVLLVFLFVRGPLGDLGHTLRELFPLLLLPALYSALDILNGYGAVAVHDAQVRRWEEAIFGTQLSIAWWQTTPSELWSTIFHAAYFAYYPIIIAPVAWFLLRRDLPSARRSVFWLLTVFTVSYLCFLAYPVAGPYYEFPRPPGWLLDNAPARLVYSTLEDGSAYGAAFPSSHVAAAMVATASAWVGTRAVGMMLLLPTILLTLGVVYCQMHYGVDALAGLVVGGAVVWWGVRRER